MIRAAARAVLPVVLLVPGAVADAAALPDAPGCPARLERPPRSARDVECALSNFSIEHRDVARAALEAWRAEEPGDPWRVVAVGRAQVERPGEGARAPLEQAVETFADAGDRVGEAYARMLLVRMHQRRRGVGEIAEQLPRVDALLAGLDDPLLRAWRALLAGREGLAAGEYDAAHLRYLRVIAEPTFDGLPAELRVQTLRQAAVTGLALGRYSEAVGHSRRAMRLCEEFAHCREDHLYLRARATRYRFANGLAERDAAAELTRRAYDVARERGARWAEMLQLCELGPLTDPPESLVWFERCAELAGSLHCEDIRLIALAQGLVDGARHDPSRIAAAIPGLRDIAERTERLGMAAEEIQVWAHLATLHRLHGDLEAERNALLRAVQLAERLQERQTQPRARADAIALSAWHFYRLAALQAADEASSRGIEEAFEVLERLRVRASLTELRRARIVAPATADADALAAVRETIAGLQARLRRPGLPEEERAGILAGLEQAELDEQAQVLTLAETDPAVVRFERPPVATLSALQSLLAPDEAFVAYQLTSPIAIGPWALVVRPDTARVVPLPDARVEPTFGLYLGMLERRDGSERPAADRLAAALIAPVVDALGPGIARLVVVPDGGMFGLPLGALPRRPGGEPLARGTAVALVTSATQLVALREAVAGRETLRRRALALAGPDFALEATPAGGPHLRSGGSRGPGMAAEEARALLARLDGAGRLLERDAATEDALKRADLGPFGVVHFAAHAVSNHSRPARSAVILEPGAAGEDGLLQPHEIAGLEFADTLVVLSACGSAEGPTVRGGGPMSLAQAFLTAGAPAVVGTLWPVRDVDAARFAELFYAELAGGARAADAVAGAQRALLDAGEPAAHWGAYVLIGAGEVRLAAAGTTAGPGPGTATFVALALAALLLLGGALAWRRAGRSARR